MIADDYYKANRKPVPEPPKPALQYCPSCSLSTRPVEGSCGRCGKSYA